MGIPSGATWFLLLLGLLEADQGAEPRFLCRVTGLPPNQTSERRNRGKVISPAPPPSCRQDLWCPGHLPRSPGLLKGRWASVEPPRRQESVWFRIPSKPFPWPSRGSVSGQKPSERIEAVEDVLWAKAPTNPILQALPVLAFLLSLLLAALCQAFN